MRRLALLLLFISSCCVLTAQQLEWEVAQVNRQKSFKKTVPPGNYSGIAHLGGNRYAVVDDKSPQDGYWLFSIDVDSLSGQIVHAQRLEFRGSNGKNRDAEGIAFNPSRQLIYISGERDNEVVEYTTDGQPTGRRLQIPAAFHHARRNAGLESLAFNTLDNTFWTTSELPLPGDSAGLLRLQQFDADLQPTRQLFYRLDATEIARRGRYHQLGACELLAVGRDSLLVLERELYIPKKNIGARVINKLFLCDVSQNSIADDSIQLPATVSKRLLCRWQTRINLTRRSFANYEAMCLVPKLSDGRQVLLFFSDSQHHFKGLLKDWFKTIIVK